ncbi:DUF1707 domain-containing protein [Streptomyces sp. NPDC050560]|uniref:DUF1707 SHOCT-like domain-containing protein n=1 Tax=Streptomyces sp. NPDC050560 TaxID=3365630 RepID=UPI0037B609EB
MTDAAPPRGENPGSTDGGSTPVPAKDTAPAARKAAAAPAKAAASPLEMRASDNDRDRVVDRLREALTEGRLDLAEFEERFEVAYRAKTYGELEAVLHDLPDTGAAAPTAGLLDKRRSGDLDNWSSRIGGTPSSSGAFAMWSGFERKGRWTVARRFTAFTMFGGGEIDLREARFEDREIRVRCFAVMGGMGVIVPPGLNVEVKGFALMGGFGRPTDDDDPDPDSPTVRISGFALMGGVGVRRKARKRKGERKGGAKGELEGK